MGKISQRAKYRQRDERTDISGRLWRETARGILPIHNEQSFLRLERHRLGADRLRWPARLSRRLEGALPAGHATRRRQRFDRMFGRFVVRRLVRPARRAREQLQSIGIFRTAQGNRR